MKTNQLKAGAILSYMSMGVGYIVSIIYTPIMLRLLGQSEFGLYNLVASVVAYLGVLNFGFGSAYMRYYSRYRAQEDQGKISKLNGMFLIIFSFIGLIAVIAGTLLALNTEIIFGSELTISELNRAKVLMMILVLNLAISFPNMVFVSYITANEKFIFQKIVEMLKVLINPFIILPVLIMGYGSIGMVVATTFLNIIIEIVNAVYCIKKLKMRFSFNNFDFKLMKEMTVFSSFVFMNLIVDQINWNVDKLILGRFHGTGSVAVYGIAAQLFTYYMSLSAAISSVFIPRVHSLVAKGNCDRELTILFTKVGRVQLMLLGMISSGIIIFGRKFLEVWAGLNYIDAFPIIILLVIPSTIPLFQNIGIEIQRAKNMHQFRSWLYLLIALGNLVITIPLAREYGGVGAALGTAIGQIIGNTIIMNVYYHKRINIDMLFFWKEIIKIIPSIVFPFILAIIMTSFLDFSRLSIFISAGIGYVLVYSFSMLKWGMNDFEKQLFIKPLKRLVKNR